LPKTNIEHFKTGDFLFIQHCGAYCYAKSSHFNGRQYGGMFRIDKDNQVIQTNIAENMCLNSIYTTYQWPCIL
jgi:diaminopimelate decarboxylase